MITIRKLEAELWESADLLCAGSKLNIKSILYAGAWAYFPVVCLQPFQAGRGGDPERPSEAWRDSPAG